jgi:small subunit ribosomal protein S11
MAEEKNTQQAPQGQSAELAANPAKAKKRTVKVDAIGEAHIHAAFNNIIITLTNMKGQTISWSSAGKMGFRGSKKNTPYAATVAASDAARVAYEAGLRKVKVYIKGPGGGRETALRALYTNKIEITEIIDLTPIPHNGCRPPKKRRV